MTGAGGEPPPALVVARRARQTQGMTVRWFSVVVDCQDLHAQARWWADTLDWRLVYEADDEAVIVPPHALDPSRLVPLHERGPGLVFVPVPEGKTVKNRLHIDLAPGPEDDQATDVQALLDYKRKEKKTKTKNK